jgi:hypothetical protein
MELFLRVRRVYMGGSASTSMGQQVVPWNQALMPKNNIKTLPEKSILH